MRNALPISWSATAYLSFVRALPRPHPAATYQVVDVGGPTSSSLAPAEIVYETVAITKSYKPKTVTEPPLTVTVTPTTISTTTILTSTSIASSSATGEESAARPSSYTTSIANSSVLTLPLPTNVESLAKVTTTTSVVAYIPETLSLSSVGASSTWTDLALTTSPSVAVYTEPINTWTSAQEAVATSVAVLSSSAVSSLTEPAWTEAPAIVQPMSTWQPSTTTAMQTVYETVYVAAPTGTSSAPARTTFPTYAGLWNTTQPSANATLSASQTQNSVWKAPMNIHLAV